MALTRGDAEQVLIKRCAGPLSAASLDGTTVGTNADLNDPLAYAVRTLGGTVTNAVAVADGDLNGISADDYEALFALAELRVLETCHSGVADQVDLSVGPRREALGQTARHLETKIQRLEAKLRREYGLGLGTLTAGVLDLDFMEKSGT